MASSNHSPTPLPDGWSTPLPDRRLGPLPEAEWTPEVEEILGKLRPEPGREVMNIFATFAHHPQLLKRWLPFGNALLFRGKLPARERELLILRTAWNCRAHYEWAHHLDIAAAAGLDQDAVDRVPAGPDAQGWAEAEALLLRAADELHSSARVTATTWAGLAELYDEAQLVEICMLVGQYHLVAFTLNSTGVQLEE